MSSDEEIPKEPTFTGLLKEKFNNLLECLKNPYFQIRENFDLKLKDGRVIPIRISVYTDKPRETDLALSMRTYELHEKYFEQKIQDALEERAKRIKEDFEERHGKTVVYVNRCWECGCWRIIGGRINKFPGVGRLPYNDYKLALQEMEEAFSEEANKVRPNEILSSAVQPTPSGKWDLETTSFVFKIISEDYDGC
jgi:hypothetical protein